MSQITRQKYLKTYKKYVIINNVVSKIIQQMKYFTINVYKYKSNKKINNKKIDKKNKKSIDIIKYPCYYKKVLSKQMKNKVINQ